MKKYIKYLSFAAIAFAVTATSIDIAQAQTPLKKPGAAQSSSQGGGKPKQTKKEAPKQTKKEAPKQKQTNIQSTNSSTLTSKMKQTTPIDQHDMVDLGLSVMWATCNVGATRPEDVGIYYSWGEVLPKKECTYNNSLNYDVSYSTLVNRGVIDNAGVLTPDYDAAKCQWGKNWRMPTYEEFNELKTMCTYEFVTYNGVNGAKFTGPNGNWIFMPVSGFKYGEGGGVLQPENGKYWTSTCVEDDQKAFQMHFDDDPWVGVFETTRETGQPVRAVYDGNSKGSSTSTKSTSSTGNYGTTQDMQWVDLGLSVKWAVCNLGATSQSDFGNFYSWGETYTKDNYVYDYSMWKGKDASDLKSIGVINAKNVLYPEYDVATATLGSKWRMPTKAEIEELIRKCSWTECILDDIECWLVTGPNGNSIFIPMAGYMYEDEHRGSPNLSYYWSSTCDSNESMHAYCLSFENSTYKIASDWFSYGFPVRPVTY